MLHRPLILVALLGLLAATPTAAEPAHRFPDSLAAGYVTDIQERLAAAGFYGGAVDGVAGPAFARAVRAYQRATGLPETGTADMALINRLHFGPAVAAPAPSRAAADPWVLRIQRGLAAAGYNPGPADGAMGVRTAAAIAAFEHDHGMVVTGRTSPALLEALGPLDTTAADGAPAPRLPVRPQNSPKTRSAPPPTAPSVGPAPGEYQRFMPKSD